MSTERPRSSSTPHVHGPHCSHCGTALRSVQEYTIEDRFGQVLLSALCAQMGAELSRAKRRATFSVRAEPQVLDELSARLQTLMVQLDERLMTVAEDFLREHTGQQIHRRAR
ncbi:MAG: hypothetical protein R3A52_02045 [Polyangiales bacterium]